MGKKVRRQSQRDALLAALDSPLFLALADAAPATVLVLDLPGEPLLASTNSRLGPLSVTSWLDLIEPSDRPVAEALWLRAGLEIKPQESELSIRTTGAMERVRCRIAPLEVKQSFLGWVVTFSEAGTREATELQALRLHAIEAEKRQEEAQALLERSETQRLEAISRLQNLEGLLGESRAHLSEVLGQRDNTQALLEGSKAQLARMMSQVRELEEHLASSNARFMDAEGLRRDLQSRLEESETQLVLMTSQLQAFERQMTGRDAHSLEAQAQLEQGVARVHELEDLLKKADARLVEIEEQRSELLGFLQQSEAQRHEKEAALEASEAQRRELLVRLHRFEEHLQITDQRSREAEAPQNEARSLLQMSDAQRSEAQVLLKQSDAERITVEPRGQRTEAELAQALTRVSELEELIENSNARIQVLETQRNELEATLEESKARLAQAAAQLQQLGERLQRKESEQLETTARVGVLEELLAGIQAQFAETQNQLVQALARGREVQTLLEESQAQRSEAEAHKEAAEVRLAQALLVRKEDQALLETREAQLAGVIARPREWEASSDISNVLPVITKAHRVDAEDRNKAEEDTKSETPSEPASMDLEERAPPQASEQQVTKARPSGEAAGTLPETSALLVGENRRAVPTANLEGDRREPESPAAQDAEVQLDQPTTRLRSRVLRQAFARWRAARGVGTAPRFEGWSVALPETIGYLVIQLDETGRPAQVLDAHPLADSPLLHALATPPGREGQSWQRCATTCRPAHDYARVEMAPHGAVELERLLLPFSTTGARVDRLVMLMATDEAEAVSRQQGG